MPSHSLPAIIPSPAKCETLPGRHSLLPSTRIIASPELMPIALRLQSVLQLATGWAFEIDANTAVEKASQDPFLQSAICLGHDANIPNFEGYRLQVGWTAIRIQASDAAGAFYAVQTLLQLLPAAVHQSVPRRDVEWSLPCVNIEDGPRFAWRGVMLDSSRFFQPVAFIKKFLDVMALHKLNVFHWHLIDDQGWRLEIKKYPRLTEIGSRRQESCFGHLTYNAGGDGVPHEGFYSQEDVREIVAYAAQRFITIMPEIEMPGHVQSAIAAYPELGCTSERLEVSTSWGIHPHLYNADKTTLQFIQDVLEETLSLFPGKFIHVGGDEAEMGEWEKSPAIQARIKELGLKDERALQHYLISRVSDFLTQRGRRLIGWDEILESGLPAHAMVMSWRGMGLGVTAANAGHDVVMTPTEGVYLDFYQSFDTSAEPLAIGGHLPLEAVYAFDPVAPGISPENLARVRGLQAQIWTEYMPTPTHVEYMAFPRLSALSEVAWTPLANRDFEAFKSRLRLFLKRLDIMGVRYRPLDGSVFNS